MNVFTAKKRFEIRSALEKNRKHSISGDRRIADLGMHFMDADGTPVLVSVEVNVPRLLGVLGERLARSKNGTARLAHGSVRLEISTPEGKELCVQIYRNK